MPRRAAGLVLASAITVTVCTGAPEELNLQGYLGATVQQVLNDLPEDRDYMVADISAAVVGVEPTCLSTGPDDSTGLVVPAWIDNSQSGGPVLALAVIAREDLTSDISVRAHAREHEADLPARAPQQ